MIELVKKESPEGIWVGDMKDGDVGVIVNWSLSGYSNIIVQLHNDSLIMVGQPADHRWTNVPFLDKSCRVRLLEKGEMLVVT